MKLVQLLMFTWRKGIYLIWQIWQSQMEMNSVSRTLVSCFNLVNIQATTQLHLVTETQLLTWTHRYLDLLIHVEEVKKNKQTKNWSTISLQMHGSNVCKIKHTYDASNCFMTSQAASLWRFARTAISLEMNALADATLELSLFCIILAYLRQPTVFK